MRVEVKSTTRRAAIDEAVRRGSLWYEQPESCISWFIEDAREEDMVEAIGSAQPKHITFWARFLTTVSHAFKNQLCTRCGTTYTEWIAWLGVQ